ncbi:MAG: hypothetical protein NT072_01795 [Deltaproteobacteria bacterium]|nr:hypothetical protein [Deltaproteobacteria bacterium]
MHMPSRWPSIPSPQCVGKHGSPDTEKMRAFLSTGFIPETMVLFHPSGSDAPLIESLAPFTKGMDMKEGRATAYVCSQGACRLPTTDLREMASLLAVKTPRKSN